MSDYKSAGVDIDAGNEAVRRIRRLAKSTFTPGVLSEIGSFGGLFRLDRERFEEPVLVSSADGVGTKLKVAFMTGRHDTVGGDLVNHCVNDILMQGAEPLFFLDYLATGRLEPNIAEQVVGGIARACRENACALIGGETAEMPGFYAEGEYDIAGFIVGVVDRSRIIDGRGIVPGDVLIGLPSAGLHTNGYSLARRVFFEIAGWKANTYVGELGKSAGDALLAPHRSYLNVLKPVIDRRWAKGLAHITGGHHRKPAAHPAGRLRREIDTRAWQVPAIFECCSNVAISPATRCSVLSTWALDWSLPARRAMPIAFSIRFEPPEKAARVRIRIAPASAAFDTSKKMHLAFCIQL